MPPLASSWPHCLHNRLESAMHLRAHRTRSRLPGRQHVRRHEAGVQSRTTFVAWRDACSEVGTSLHALFLFVFGPRGPASHHMRGPRTNIFAAKTWVQTHLLCPWTTPPPSPLAFSMPSKLMRGLSISALLLRTFTISGPASWSFSRRRR